MYQTQMNPASKIQRTLAACGAETFAQERHSQRGPMHSTFLMAEMASAGLAKVDDFDKLRNKALAVELRFDHVLSRFSVELSPPSLHTTKRDVSEDKPYLMELSAWGNGPIDVRGDVAAQLAKELRAQAERLTAAAAAVEAQAALTGYDAVRES